MDAGAADESAWLKAKRKVAVALTATEKLSDKGDSAAARRRAHNDGLRAEMSNQPEKRAQGQAQWTLSAAEMDTVSRVAHLLPSQRTTEDTNELLGVLRGTEFFMPLDEATAVAMAGALTWQEYDQDELVFAERSVGDSFYLIVSGSLAVLMRDKDDKETICSAAELYPGDSFGEASFLDMKKRTVSVCALEKTTALKVQRDDYLTSLKAWHSAQLQRKLALIHSAPLLASEARKTLKPWAERLVEEVVPKGTEIISQGQEAKRMYFIMSGECTVNREVVVPPRPKAPTQLKTFDKPKPPTEKELEQIGKRHNEGKVLLDAELDALRMVTGKALKHKRPSPRGPVEYTEATTETLQVARLGARDVFGEQGVLLDVPHTATVVAQSEVRLLSIHKIDLMSVGDAAVIQRLSDAARDYPSDAEARKMCDTGEHWRSYKDALIVGVLDKKRSRRWSCGARPGQPERDEVLCRPRGYSIPAAVRAEYLILEESTPVLEQDLTDATKKLERRVALRRNGIDPQLGQFLASRPGGANWTGNEMLRAYARKEAEKLHAPSPRRATSPRSRRGRRSPPRGDLSRLKPTPHAAAAREFDALSASGGSFGGGGRSYGAGHSSSRSSNALRRNLDELRRSRDPLHHQQLQQQQQRGLGYSASTPALGTFSALPLGGSMSQASLAERSGRIPALPSFPSSKSSRMVINDEDVEELAHRSITSTLVKRSSLA